MRFSAVTVVFASLVASAVAQVGCQAEYVVQQCIQDTMPMLQACKANDWACMCDKSNNVLICYNNCPGDDARASAKSQNEYYCNAAKANSPSATTLASSGASASAAVTPTSSMAGASASSSASGSAVSSSAQSLTATKAAASATPSPSTGFVENTNASSGAGSLAVDALGLLGVLALAVL